MGFKKETARLSEKTWVTLEKVTMTWLGRRLVFGAAVPDARSTWTLPL